MKRIEIVVVSLIAGVAGALVRDLLPRRGQEARASTPPVVVSASAFVLTDGLKELARLEWKTGGAVLTMKDSALTERVRIDAAATTLVTLTGSSKTGVASVNDDGTRRVEIGQSGSVGSFVKLKNGAVTTAHLCDGCAGFPLLKLASTVLPRTVDLSSNGLSFMHNGFGYPLASIGITPSSVGEKGQVVIRHYDAAGAAQGNNALNVP